MSLASLLQFCGISFVSVGFRSDVLARATGKEGWNRMSVVILSYMLLSCLGLLSSPLAPSPRVEGIHFGLCAFTCDVCVPQSGCVREIQISCVSCVCEWFLLVMSPRYVMTYRCLTSRWLSSLHSYLFMFTLRSVI